MRALWVYLELPTDNRIKDFHPKIGQLTIEGDFGAEVSGR